jgi:hypothetical protein
MAEAPMNDEDLAELILLARTLGVETSSEKIKDACQVVLKAAMARRSRLRRDAKPPASPYYGPNTQSAEVGTITWTQEPDTETR